LIAPAPEWDLDGQWEPDAQRVHKISKWDLRSGAPVREVMTTLNMLARPFGTVWCDGGCYDLRWLDALAKAGGSAPTFQLLDLSVALRANEAVRLFLAQRLAGSPPPHRAGPDAERLCTALASFFSS
jgi:hypothetical protein